MPAPIAVEKRREIVKRHEAGESLKAISDDLHLSYNTVKKIWAHWLKYQKVTPNYEQAKQKGTRQYRHIYEAALTMRRAHPRWGAALIRLKLGEAHPAAKLPSVRSLQRWFRAAGIGRSPKVRQSKAEQVTRGYEVHQVWAIDAKERMKLADGTSACWLVVSDEASGAILEAKAFPPVALDKS